MNAKEAVERAFEKQTIIPAFNIPYLPMMKPVVQAIIDENSVCMVQVARVEWEKFQAESIEAVALEYEKYKDPAHTLLHLDHVPVIDEDLQQVDYIPLLQRAIKAGYQSMMIDASRLDFEGNIKATQNAAAIAHDADIPLEAELGSVMGHESEGVPPYEEIFASKQGFTDVKQARIFAKESGCDWLSVAVGSIHGAVAEGMKDRKKPEARLDIEHIKLLKEAVGLPLVLHGGSGIQKEYIMEGIKNGIAKINVGTEIRQAYEQALAKTQDVSAAQQATYDKTVSVIKDFFEISNNKDFLFG